MGAKNTLYWLRGFLEGKESIDIDQLKKIKEVLGVEHKPSKEQVDKMMTNLFPDLKDEKS